MQINSIQPYINKVDTTVKKHPNATKAIAAAAITSTSVLVATRAPKGVANQLKVSQRLSRAGIAGGVALAAVSLLSINKEQVVQAVNKVKEVFKRNPAEKELDKMEPVDTNDGSFKSSGEQIDINQASVMEERPDSFNPFAPKVDISAATVVEEDKNSTNPFVNDVHGFALNEKLNISPALQKPNMIGGLGMAKPNTTLNAGMVSPLG